MGAWAETAFGNDGAADWADDVEEAGTLEPVETALKAVLHPNGCELGDEGLAAASLVSWLNGKPTAELADESCAYSEGAIEALKGLKRSEQAAALLPLAISVVTRLLDPSDNELWEVWTEGDTDPEENNWVKENRRLLELLKSAQST